MPCISFIPTVYRILDTEVQKDVVLVKLSVQEDLSGFFCLFLLKSHKQEKVIKEILNSRAPDAKAGAVY